MSTPKTYPPYRIENENGDSWIVDRHGNDVVRRVSLTPHYADAKGFADGEIWPLICDALNAREYAEEVGLAHIPTPESDLFYSSFADGEALPSQAEWLERMKGFEHRLTVAREALKATMKIIGPPENETWVTDDELNAAWDLAVEALTQTAPK